MTLASDISTTSTALSDIKQAIINKGVTPSGNITTYATAIGQISGGSSPVINSLNITPTTSSQTITASGGVDGYSPITVSAVTSSIDQNITAGNIKKDVVILGVTGSYEGSGGGGVGIPREVSAQGVYQIPTSSFTFSLPSNVTEVGYFALCNAFKGSTGLTSVDLSSLTTISGQSGISSAFAGCTSLTSVDLSSLTTISGQSGLSFAFDGCTSLTSVSFPALTTMLVYGCLSSAFAGCTSLTSVSFPALTTESFGSNITSQFSGMMRNTGTNTTHTLHFPSNMESTIQGLYGYPLFGGTSGYVVLAFDLPATS